MRNRNKRLLGVVLAGLVTVAVVRGQETEPAPAGYNATSATVERIMETAVGNIARRYNLDEQQRQATDELMKREVRRFLREHEGEVWPAIRGLLASQMGASPPDDPEAIKQLGATARPLAELAREAIFQANEEWRKILTEEQKKTHDFDMAEMRKTFEHIEKNLRSWELGKPLDSGVFPSPSGEIGPARPPKPRANPKTVILTKTIPIGILDTFVEEFIKDYKLDEAQITAARSILAEYKGKAKTFQNTTKTEFAKVIAQREKAVSERNAKAIRAATATQKKLLQPFYALFAEMEQRLKSQLTSAQIAQHEERTQPAKTAKKPSGTKKSPKPKPAEAKAGSGKADAGKPASGSRKSDKD